MWVDQDAPPAEQAKWSRHMQVTGTKGYILSTLEELPLVLEGNT
jgi:hypothetical protein